MIVQKTNCQSLVYWQNAQANLLMIDSQSKKESVGTKIWKNPKFSPLTQPEALL